MAGNVKVQVILGAVDRASGIVKKFGANLTKAANKASISSAKMESGLLGRAKNMARAFSSIEVSALAVVGAVGAAGFAITKFSIDAAKYEGVRNAFGVMTAGMVADTGKFIEAIKKASAGTLSNMEIMKGAVGAFTLIGKEAFVDFEKDFTHITELITKTSIATGDSVDYLYDSFVRGVGRASPLILDNLKIQVRAEETNKAYAKSIGKSADELTFQDQKTALLLESTRQLEEKFGDVDIAGGNFALTIQSLKASFIDLTTSLGQGFLPGAELLVDMLVGPLKAAFDYTGDNLVTLQYAFLGVAGAIRMMANVVVGAVMLMFGALKSLVTFSFKPLEEAAASVAGMFIESFVKIEEKGTRIAERAVNKQVNAVKKGTDKMVDSYDKKASKIAKALKKETETYERQLKRSTANFEREMEKRSKTFERSLQDLIFSHIDKRDALKDDLKEENADYNEALEERTADNKETLEEMADDHEDKVEDIQKSLDKEVALGDAANLQKLADLRETLAEENADYAEAVLKETERQEKATAKAKKEHEKRLADTQAKLDAENEILKKHQSDVDAVKDKAREDDISRLKRQHEEEVKEAQEQFDRERKLAKEDHERRLIEKAEQGESEGAAYGGGMAGGLEPKLDEIKKSMEEAGKTAGTKFATGIGEGAYEAGKALFNNLIDGVKERVDKATRLIGGTGGAFFQTILQQLGPVGELIALRKSGRLHTGGVVPGPVGRDVPIMAQAGEVVTPVGAVQDDASIGMGKKVELNVYIGLYAGSETERREIARKLWEDIDILARSQGKSPLEILPIT